MVKLGRKMLKNAKKVLKNNKGFTLLELIIVIAIMGFLVAMVAPRLEGIGSKASGTVDDGSTKVVEGVLSRYLNETNKLPNKLGSLMPATGVTPGEPLSSVSAGSTANNKFIWDGKKSMGKVATFDASFEEKNKLYVHVLNQDEADALKEMGIKELVSFEGLPKNVESGTQVMMIGGGAASALDTAKIDDKIAVGDKFADPTLAYRIVLAISDESELITEGYMKKGSQSAVQGDSEKYIKNTGYSIVLPRLPQSLLRIMTPGATPAYHGTGKLELKEIGKNGLATTKTITVPIMTHQSSKDALIISPTGVVGTGNGSSGFWEVTAAKDEM